MTKYQGVRLDLLNGTSVEITPLIGTVGDPSVMALDLTSEDGESVVLEFSQDHWEIFQALVSEY